MQEKKAEVERIAIYYLCTESCVYEDITAMYCSQCAIVDMNIVTMGARVNMSLSTVR